MAPVIGDPIPAGWSNNKFNVVNNSSGTALDVAGPENGRDVHGWYYDETNDNQVWLFTLIDRNANIWTLQNPGYGHYLEVENGTVHEGTLIRSRERYGNADMMRHTQEWYIYLVEGAGGSARIALQNVASGTFLNMWCGSRDNGAKIVGYPWDSSDCTIWRLVQQI